MKAFTLIILEEIFFITACGACFSEEYYGASIVMGLWAIVSSILHAGWYIANTLKEQREKSIVERIEELMKKQEEIM